MNSPKTITKQTLTKDIDQRQPRNASSAAPAPKVGEEMHIEITRDRIRERAYEIYQARNGAPGDAESDWHQAERESHHQPVMSVRGGL